jgi:hypothetical protein
MKMESYLNDSGDAASYSLIVISYWERGNRSPISNHRSGGSVKTGSYLKGVLPKSEPLK